MGTPGPSTERLSVLERLARCSPSIDASLEVHHILEAMIQKEVTSGGTASTGGTIDEHRSGPVQLMDGCLQLTAVPIQVGRIGKMASGELPRRPCIDQLDTWLAQTSLESRWCQACALFSGRSACQQHEREKHEERTYHDPVRTLGRTPLSKRPKVIALLRM